MQEVKSDHIGNARVIAGYQRTDLQVATAFCKLDDMPRYKGGRPKRITLNNYMDTLRDGSQFPWE